MTFTNIHNKDAKQRDFAQTFKSGLTFSTEEIWKLNGNISTGYRMPNVDDIGKLFESVPGNVTVPNPDLVPEYAWNFEVGIIKHVPHKFRIELNGFHKIGRASCRERV